LAKRLAGNFLTFRTYDQHTAERRRRREGFGELTQGRHDGVHIFHSLAG
jgi:hypothetical protein